MTARLLCPTLVAREEEQAVLAEALAGAARGQGQTILIGGEAGVGKSALVRAFAESARAAAGRVLVGECTEIDALSPLGPFLQIIETARRASLIRLEDANRVGPLPEGDIDATARPRLYQGLARVFAGIARSAPLVLVVEDLHWADEATLELFRYLPRHVRTERSILIGTYRTDELHRRHPLRPLLADLSASRLARTIDLAPLRRAETVRLIRETLGLQREVPTELSNAIYERCEGNPFFIEETLEAMRARGALRYRDGRWIGIDSPEFALPDSVRDAVGGRFALLGDEAQRMLRVAAVIGQRFNFDLLALVAEIPHENLVDLLRAAIEAQLIVERDARGSFAFRHALTRESVLAELLEPEQRAWHRAIALALEQRPESADLSEELAYHFDAGGERERAFGWHVTAAERARPFGAFRAAKEHLRRAIELAPPEYDLFPLLGNLAQDEGFIEMSRGERAWQDIYQRATAAGRAFEAGWALAYVGAYEVYGSSPRAGDTLRRAVELLEPFGDTKELAHAYHFLAQWHLYSGELELGIPPATRAIEIADAIGARTRAVAARVTRSMLSSDPAATAAMLRAAIDETRANAARLNDLSARVGGATGPLSRWYTDLFILQTGLLSAERDALIEEWQTWADSINYDDGSLRWARAQVAFGRGDFDQVLRVVEETRDASSYSLQEQMVDAFVRISRDGAEAGADIITRVRSMDLRPGAQNAAWRELAQIALLRDDLRAILEEPGAGARWRNPRIGKGVITALFAARALQDHAATQEWYARADELRERRDFPHFAATYADAERAIEAGDAAAGARLIDAVADAADRFDAPAVATRLRLRRAELLRERDPAAAMAELVRVVTFWRKAKATWYLGRLEEWAREHELRWPADPAGARRSEAPNVTKALTEREFDVVRLVALGLTNREIADRLVISERTAEGHVQRILDKLGFRSRSQVAAWHASGRRESATANAN